MAGIDDLLCNFSSVSVTKEENSIHKTHPRFDQYKCKSSNSDQCARRQDLLERQKCKRSEKTALLRDIDGEEFCEEKAENPFKNQLMLSEWLVDVPADFSSEWLLKICPVGHRSLVVATRGKTKSYTKSGYHTETFQSALPGGNRRSKTGHTVLDCVWSEVTGYFYVLDVMSYRSHPILDSETEFRFFWGQSKLQEELECSITEVTSRNKYPFLLVPSHACSSESLHAALSTPVQYKVDGLLFYHKRAHYVAGTTPLVGWLKPEMASELLSLEISISDLTQSDFPCQKME